MAEKQLVLIGFGPHNLEDMLAWRGTEKEEDLLFAPDKWPPRFKPESSCSLKESEIFVEYVKWATDLMNSLAQENK